MSGDMFLRLGTVIKGEAQDSVHNGKIDVHSWSWGMTQSGTTHEGLGGGGGKVNVQDMTLTKLVDSATHDILKHTMSGIHIPDAELIVRKAGGDNPVEYLRILMTDVIISSYSTGGHKDQLDRVSETISLNFAKVEVFYTKQGADGAAGAESSAGWDIKQNAAV